ncbi:MAG TPA: DMT family transporter [Burkholderiales bacterium]|nr:DMT family transporter [Burkholderiales bacterium]
MTANLRGALWMLGAVASFCAMAIAARELLKFMGTFEILFFRTGIAFFIVLAFAAREGFGQLRTRRIGTHLWRNLFHFGGQASWVWSIGMLPLATVFAIEFTMPVWAAVFAALFLGERLSAGRIVMLVLGLLGVLIILRPGIEALQPAALVMLAGAWAFGVQMIGTKQLSATDSPLCVLFWMSIIQTPFSLALAAPVWAWPHAALWPWVVLVGIGSFTAHYCLTSAFRNGDVTIIVPIDFVRLPAIAVIGALFYAEPFDPWILLGAAVIFAGVYFGLFGNLSRKR